MPVVGTPKSMESLSTSTCPMQGVEPILAVRDVPSTIRFYRDVLGFENGWLWGDDGGFGGASWGNVRLLFQRSEGGPFGVNLFFSVRDQERLYERHLSQGVVETPIEDKPWGRREYVVRDPDGHRLRIAGRIPSTADPSVELPDSVSFEERAPTLEEFNRLREAVAWKRSESPEVLTNTWAGVVALNEGQAVGMARITMDSEGWFGIWDVVVKPELQGRRVGEGLMSRALQIVRRRSPGALVFLFTFRDEFYQKIGFRVTDAMIREA